MAVGIVMLATRRSIKEAFSVLSGSPGVHQDPPGQLHVCGTPLALERSLRPSSSSRGGTGGGGRCVGGGARGGDVGGGC